MPSIASKQRGDTFDWERTSLESLSVDKAACWCYTPLRWHTELIKLVRHKSRLVRSPIRDRTQLPEMRVCMHSKPIATIVELVRTHVPEKIAKTAAAMKSDGARGLNRLALCVVG